MKKQIFFALISIHSTAYADTWSADSFGNTTGRIGGERLHTYSDSLGNTTGRIGDETISIYRDSLGNTSGRIGDQRLNTYSASISIAQRYRGPR
jgi:hypothetical protein